LLSHNAKIHLEKSQENLATLNSLTYKNKNLAIANRSRVSYAHIMSRASIGLITNDIEI